jgi:hypothetical protein
MIKKVGQLRVETDLKRFSVYTFKKKMFIPKEKLGDFCEEYAESFQYEECVK